MRKMRRRKKRIAILSILIIVLIAAILALVLLLWPKTPNLIEEVIEEAMMKSKSDMTLKETDDGLLLLEWHEADNAVGYKVLIYSAVNTNDLIFSKNCTETNCIIPGVIPRDQLVTIQVKAQSTGRNGEIKEERVGIKATTFLDVPEARDIQSVFDPDTGKLSFNWQGYSDDTYRFNLVKDNNASLLINQYGKTTSSAFSFLDELNHDEVGLLGEITIGEGGTFSIPQSGESYTFQLSVQRIHKHLVFYGKKSNFAVITDDDFLPETIKLSCSEVGENSYSLEWTKAKGDGYEIQYMIGKSDEWKVLGTVNDTEGCSYDTGRMPPGKDIKFRVLPQGAEDKWQDTEENVVMVHTVYSPVYATIWPTKKLDVYADSSKSSTVGKVNVLQTLCVLSVENDLFEVKTDTCQGFIDSSYCMINLPEYIGDDCAYDITNSYASIYLVHEYAIPNVSATVVAGYENILLDDNTFIVPLLYPCAVKFVSAVQAAKADGYIIKIYDSFRPYIATRSIYDETEKIIDWEIPSSTYKRITLNDFRNLTAEGYSRAYDAVPANQWPVAPVYSYDRATPESIDGISQYVGTENYDEYEEATDSSDGWSSAFTYEEAAQPEYEEIPVTEENNVETEQPEAIAVQESGASITPEDSLNQENTGESVSENQAQQYTPDSNVTTYRKMMTNGSFSLSSFLAAKGSTHNHGIAMDMTLISLSGDELKMQTNMHDLSHYSAVSNNNDIANKLNSYMTNAGYKPLSSEWWHFQDNESSARYRPPTVNDGVSIEGWKYDGRGWKYRLAKGAFYEDKIVSIDGVEYAFDVNGYTDRQ